MSKTVTLGFSDKAIGAGVTNAKLNCLLISKEGLNPVLYENTEFTARQIELLLEFGTKESLLGVIQTLEFIKRNWK